MKKITAIILALIFTITPVYASTFVNEYGNTVCTDGFKSNAAAGSYVGRLYINSLGISTALYNSSSQATCDAWDSACYIPYGNGTLIADHVNQGFSAIKSAVPDQTFLYIYTNNTYYRYLCTGIDYNGYNATSALLNCYGNDIKSGLDNKIALYTCNNNGTVTIVYFKPY